MDRLAKSIVVGGIVGMVGILAGGCRTETSDALGYRRFRLSPARPADQRVDVKLLRVDDGPVVFQRGGETRHAKPGQPGGNPVAEWSGPRRRRPPGCVSSAAGPCGSSTSARGASPRPGIKHSRHTFRPLRPEARTCQTSDRGDFSVYFRSQIPGYTGPVPAFLQDGGVGAISMNSGG